jgi:tetratricopeptide (TPR) repeat protein
MNTTARPTPSLDIQQAIQRAHAHWSAGQADQSEQLCQRVLAVWPGQADALHLMGLMAHTHGNLDLAIANLRQACQSPRAPATYYSNLAEMCRQKGLLFEGEEAGLRAVALDPQLATAWNNLGILQQEAGKFADSRVSLERVISLLPDSPEAHNNLGNTYKRLNDPKRARAHYEKAIALRPNYAEGYSNLASLLNDNGECDAAAAAARRAIDINPQLADAYLNLAGIEVTRLRPVQALHWLNAMAAFAPLHPGAMSARARTLKQLDRLDEALEAARRAVSLAPNSAEPHNVLGQVCQALGFHDEALAEFEKAIALPGVAAEEAMLGRAAVFMEAGRQAEAQQEFSRAAQAFPLSVKSLFGRAELKRYETSDPDITRLETYLERDTSQPLIDRTTAHFALGKAYLDTGDAARAFEHLSTGNRMKRATFQYDAAATGAWMARIAEVFSPSLFERLKGGGDPSSTPIFVIGMPRSGTTLVEQVLASHPLVHGAGELPALRMVVDSVGAYPDSMARIAREQLAVLGRQYLARIAPLGARTHLVDKMPANFLYAGLIHLMLPNARIVHCRREPADTCLSCYTKLFAAEQLFSYDLAELGKFHRAYEKLMAHWRTLLPQNRLIDVHYEAVVDDLPVQARRLTDWLGLPWDESCLRFHETKRVIRTASLSQVRQPIYTSSKDRWRRYTSFLAPLLAELETDGA